MTQEQIQDLAMAIVKMLWPVPLYSLETPDDQVMRREREKTISNLITSILEKQ